MNSRPLRLFTVFAALAAAAWGQTLPPDAIEHPILSLGWEAP